MAIPPCSVIVITPPRSEKSRPAPACWTFPVLSIALLLIAVGCASTPDLRSRVYAAEPEASLANEIRLALELNDQEWPAARDRLVCHARPVLKLFNDSRIATRDSARVKDVISIALLNIVPYDDFRSHYPALHRMVRAEIEARRKLAAAIPRRDSVGTVERTWEQQRCMMLPDDCVQPPRDKAWKEFQVHPGFSVPALVDLLRDETPAIRVEGLFLTRFLAAVTALETALLLRKDSSEVPSFGGLDRSVRVDRLTSELWPLAIGFAKWHPPLRSEDDLTERQMTRAVLEFCRSDRASSRKITPLRDAWNRPIEQSYDGWALFWSDGPNGRPGDGDDIVRYLESCRSLTTELEHFSWTAAAGGATVLPPITRSVCDAEGPR